MSESATSAQAAESTQPPAGTAEVPATEAADVQSTQPEMNPDELKRLVAELRKENAGHRTRLKKFEADASAAEAAKLSDLERAIKERDAVASELNEAKAQLSRMRVESAVSAAATKAGFVNPADAFGFIDTGRIETADDGTPRNIDALVTEIAKSRPYLLGNQQARPAGSFDTGNGSRPSGSREQQLASLHGKELLAAIRSRS